MIKQADFNTMIELAMTTPDCAHMRPVIEKELLYYDILFSLDKEGLLDQLTFQGGTSLRLCHGSPRFSEALDFAGGPEFAGRQLRAIKSCIEHYIGRRYGLAVSVKEPAELQEEADYAGLTVDKWQVAVVTAPRRRDLPKQRIKIEVANIPAYSREPRPLLINYDFLPDIIHGAQFKEEMARFIPMDVQERTLNKGKFYDFLVVEIQGLLQGLNQELRKGVN